MESYLFTLESKPPSKKNSYSMGGGRFYQDEKVNVWNDASMYELLPQMRTQQVKMLTCPIEVVINLQCDMRSDLDNMISTIFDLLQKAQIIKNDRQIYQLTAQRVKSKIPKTRIVISWG